MRLNEGLKVATIRDGGRVNQFAGQLSVSSGTHRCLDQHGEFYYPNEDWHNVDAGSELHKLLTSPVPDQLDPKTVHQNAFVFQLDSVLCGQFVEFIARHKRPLEGFSAKNLVTSEEAPEFDAQVKPLLSEIERFVKPLSVDNTVLMNHHANRRSTTIESRTGHIVGLHIDNFDAVPVEERDNVGTRVCVNLGPGIRYLWIVNVSYREIVKCVSGFRDIPESYYSERPTTIAKWFMERNPDYGVVRVRMDPGTCYLAPTQQYVHDGSTAWSLHEDNIFFIRGKFGLHPVQSSSRTVEEVAPPIVET